jgi:integrase
MSERHHHNVSRHSGIYRRHSGPCELERGECRVREASRTTYRYSWLDRRGRRHWGTSSTLKAAAAAQADQASKVGRGEVVFKIDSTARLGDVVRRFEIYLETMVELRRSNRDADPPVGLKVSTATYYRGGLRLLVSELGDDMRLADVTGADLRDACARLSKRGRSGSTVHGALISGRRLFDWAIDEHLLGRNPVADVKAREVPQPRKRQAEGWDVETRRAFFDGTAGDHFSVAYRLAVSTGMRRGELAGLRWPEVDLDKGEIRVRRSRISVGAQIIDTEDLKSPAAYRTISIGPEVVKMLHEHRARQVSPIGGDGYVITDEAGGPVNPGRLSKEFADAVRRLGLPRANLHRLRHVHAQILLEQGEALEVVSRRLGHSNIGVTHAIYQQWPRTGTSAPRSG